MFDYYLARLRHALWTWRECHSAFHRAPRRKDRPSGRIEKHRARALERREIKEEQGDVD